MRRRELDELTDREREVLALLRRDFTNEQIASRLGISLDGAKYHVSQIISKLGVASREEAAAVALAERRRWWAGWPLWAKLAGAGTMAAAAAGLAVLAWVVLRTDDAAEEDVTENGPSITETSRAVDRVGTYEDPNDFSAFATQIDAAIGNGDVQFFLDNTRFEDFPCDRGGFPARPEACGEAFNSTIIPAVHIGRLQSDDYGADRAEYELLIRAFLQGFYDSVSDEYGEGRPRLYSFGVRTPEFLGPSPGEDRVDAVATSLSTSHFGRPSPPPRLVFEFHCLFEGERWVIDWLSFGADEASLALDLDPGGAGARVETTGPVWSFWQRWEQSSPTP